MPRKAKKGSPRYYFTQKTEDAIIRYNKEERAYMKQRIYNDHIRRAFDKLCENIIHTFKFYYFDVPSEQVKQEVISFLVLNMHTTGDGIISALQILEAVITIGDDLGNFIGDLSLFPQLLINVPLRRDKNWPINNKFKEVQRQVTDKLGGDGRILVRASGTEPVIRVMAEATTKRLAKECVDQLVSCL